MRRLYADGSPVWGAHGSDVFPAQYHYQLQQQMLLIGCTRADLAVQFGNQDFRVYSIEADPKLQEFIKMKAQEFTGLLDRNEPPPAISREDVKLIYADQIEKDTVPLSQKACEAVALRKALKNKIKALENEIETLQVVVELEIGNAEVGLCADGRKITHTKDKNGVFKFTYPKQ